EPLLNLQCQPGTGEIASGLPQELGDLWRQLQGPPSPARLVQQAEHPAFLEGGRDEVEGRTRVAVLRCGAIDADSIDCVGTKHFVLDLDLVCGQEERVA